MIIAVDIGGTKTLVGRFSDNGGLQTTSKFLTPRDISEFLSQVIAAIHALSGSDAPLELISIAVPGQVDDGILSYAPNLGWKHINLPALLGVHFDCPIIVENDANLAGLAETRTLKKVPRMSLYVTVSTGIGTGVINQGHINQQLSKSEGGHIVLEHDGRWVEWEKFASGKAIYETYGTYARDITDRRTWYQISKNISQGLVVLAYMLQPEVIIIGGSIGTYFDRFDTSLNDFMREYLHRDHHPRIIQAKHPEEAVLYGCYYHALDR